MMSDTDDALLVRPAPLYFELVRSCIAKNYPGAYRLNRAMKFLHEKWRILDRCAPFDLAGEEIVVPLYWPRLTAKERLLLYEQHQVREFAGAVDQLGGPCTYVDCGADIGLFTRLVLRQTKNVAEIHAIEPNPASYRIARQNLSRFPSAHVYHAAVSDYLGSATLIQPGYSDSEHAKHIDGRAGDTKVLTVDSLGLKTDKPIAIKIDVEGEELAALRGAAKTLATAPSFVVQIEANRDVIKRNGIDAIDAVKFIRSIRDVSLTVIRDQDGIVGRDLDDRPFFDQYPRYMSCDIVALSR